MWGVHAMSGMWRLGHQRSVTGCLGPDSSAFPSSCSAMKMVSCIAVGPQSAFLRASQPQAPGNLKDLSHINYLHHGMLGNDSMRGRLVKVHKKNGTIHADPWMPSDSAPSKESAPGKGDGIGQR